MSMGGGTFGGTEAGPATSPIGRLLVSFNQQAELFTYSAGADDDHGNPSGEYSSEGVWPCRLWQPTGTETPEGTEIGSFQLVVPPDCPVDANSRVLVDGVTYEVDGPPLVRRTPRGESHITATLTYESG